MEQLLIKKLSFFQITLNKWNSECPSVFCSSTTSRRRSRTRSRSGRKHSITVRRSSVMWRPDLRSEVRAGPGTWSCPRRSVRSNWPGPMGTQGKDRFSATTLNLEEKVRNEIWNNCWRDTVFKKLKQNYKKFYFVFLQTENSFLSSVKLSVKKRNEIMVMEMTT